MPPIQRTSKAQYLAGDFTLPPRHLAHDIIKYQLFEWSLLPEMPPDLKRIVMKCTMCQKVYYFGWERNWTTLKNHYESAHNLTMERVKMEAAKSSTPGEWSIIGSSLLSSRGGHSGSTTIDNYVNKDLQNDSRWHLTGMKRAPVHVPFDKTEYERLMLAMIVENDLPFSLVESESFRELINFFRDDAPTMTRSTLKRNLESIFEPDFEAVKKRLHENTGMFSITTDVWRPGDNFGFLAVSLHFYNNQYEMENYTIGFRAMDGIIKSPGKLLCDFMLDVLRKYGIEKRIISITRDNTAPMNDMMNKFKQTLKAHGTEFSGDIRCLGHALNLSTEAFLSCTFFKRNRTHKFKRFMKTLPEENLFFHTFARRLKHLPRIMRMIILQIKYNHRMRDIFKILAEEKETKESSKTGPEKRLRNHDARWLSTYHMIDRFIHFRTEITIVLRWTYGDFSESASDLEKFQLTTEDWEYLTSLRDILEVFHAPTLRLQASSYPAINYTVPLVYGVLTNLSSMRDRDDQNKNPLVAFGLEEAKKKLLECYPFHEEMTVKSNKVFYLAVVLDPRFKLATFTDSGFSVEKVQAIKDVFYEEYCEYKKAVKDDLKNDSVDSDLASPVQEKNYGFFFVDEKRRMDRNEFERYLREPREGGSQDIIAFYKSESWRFPIISRMARDYLGVSAVAASSAAFFSQVGEMVTERKGVLLDRSRQMLEILKSRGIITAEEMPAEDTDSEGAMKLDNPEVSGLQEEEEENWLVLDDDNAEEDDEEDDEEKMDASMGIFEV